MTIPTPLRFSLATLFLFVLTILSQVGGILLVMGYSAGKLLQGKSSKRRWICVATMVGTYALGLIAVPLIAKPLGRVPLPWFATESFPLRPRNLGYPLLFRNYVTPQLKETLQKSVTSLGEKHPGTIVDYLDACFPFVNGIPLLPHKSHSDGKKVDLAFLYRDRSGNFVRSPSAIGYWIYESPPEPAPPSSLFRWNMSWIQNINRDRHFDTTRNEALVRLLSQDEAVQKMFLEPHLQKRLRTGPKVRFQGMRAARHDDHLHVQIF